MARSEQKVVQYLGEAHAGEVALTRVLQSQIAMTPRGSVRAALEEHLEETRDHAARLRERIEELDAGRNPLKLVVGLTETVIGQTIALSKTPLDLVRGGGGEEKVLKNVKDAVATEALEIATYDALEALARAVGDERTAALAVSIRGDEQAMLVRLLGEIPALAQAVVRAEVDGKSSFDPASTGAGEAVVSARDAVREALDEVRGAVEDVADEARDAARQASAATTAKARSAAKQTRKVPGVVAAEGAARGAVATETDLPIKDYDRRTVDELDGRLRGLSQLELATVEAYERRHEARTTLLERIEALRAAEPWAGYDEQTAAEITKALKAATDGKVRDVRVYERDHKARAGLTKAIERRLGPAA
jgi:ferritin-like metal-binding protein YciE